MLILLHADSLYSLHFFLCSTAPYVYKTGAYPVIRGSVSVEKRASGGLSRSTSLMVYCPLCLGWRNTAMSRLQGPWAPQSQGLSTQGPPKAERFTQRNWPEGGRKTKNCRAKYVAVKQKTHSIRTQYLRLIDIATHQELQECTKMIRNSNLMNMRCWSSMDRVQRSNGLWFQLVLRQQRREALDENAWNKAALKRAVNDIPCTEKWGVVGEKSKQVFFLPVLIWGPISLSNLLSSLKQGVHQKRKSCVSVCVYACAERKHKEPQHERRKIHF